MHPVHRQQSFPWLPHGAPVAEGDFHFAPGRELHSFFMKMFHSSRLLPQIHSILVPFPALGIAALAWPSCRVLALPDSLQSLPSIPVLSSLHGKELLTEIRAAPCWSFSWAASCNVSFHTAQQLVFMQTSEKHASFRRWKAHGDVFPPILCPFCGALTSSWAHYYHLLTTCPG